MRTRPLIAIFVVTLAAAGVAHACQVPVFRYALERWTPDPYEAFVIHRGPMGESQKRLVAHLEAATINPDAPLNLRVRHVDLTGKDDELVREFVEVFGEPDGELPQVWLNYPPFVKTDRMAFRGPLTDANVKSLIDSKTRRAIVKRIVDGQSAVWVLIESGDKAADDAAEQTLLANLERLKKELTIPSIDELRRDEFFHEGTKVELKLEFSLLRVSLDDAAERPFVQTLINSEVGLHEYLGKDPIAVPVFGRGRSYYALVGRGINPDTITETCAFIAGACSCQVKEQNPGADLLIAADWNRLVVGSAIPDNPLPELTGLSAPSGDAKQPADAASSASSAVAVTPDEAPPAEVASAAGVDLDEPTASVRLPDTIVTGSPGASVAWVWIIAGVVLAGVLIAAVGTVVISLRRGEA